MATAYSEFLLLELLFLYATLHCVSEQNVFFVFFWCVVSCNVQSLCIKDKIHVVELHIAPI